MGDILQYWPVAVTVFNLIFVVSTWALMKTFATKRELDGEARSRGQAETRITIIEERLKSLPDHDDLGDIHQRINETLVGIASANAGISGLTEAVNALKNQMSVVFDNGFRK